MYQSVENTPDTSGTGNQLCELGSERLMQWHPSTQFVYMDGTRVGIPAVVSVYPSFVLHTCHMACQVYILVATVAAGTGDLDLSMAHLIASWYQYPGAAVSVYLWRNVAASS